MTLCAFTQAVKQRDAEPVKMNLHIRQAAPVETDQAAVASGGFMAWLTARAASVLGIAVNTAEFKDKKRHLVACHRTTVGSSRATQPNPSCVQSLL